MGENMQGAIIDDMPESELIAQAIEGIEKAHKTLFLRHRQRAFACAWKIVKNETIADDIVQEAFTKAFSKLSEFNQNSKFSTWLFTIVRNCSLEKIRNKQYIFVETDSPDAMQIIDNSHNPLRDLEISELRDKLNMAILQLPKNYQDGIVAIYLDDLTIESASEKLNMKVPAFKSNLLRAKKFLARLLPEYNN